MTDYTVYKNVFKHARKLSRKKDDGRIDSNGYTYSIKTCLTVFCVSSKMHSKILLFARSRVILDENDRFDDSYINITDCIVIYK